MTPEERLIRDMTANMDRAHTEASSARRAAWWADLVAREPEIPKGARLVGWDTVRVEDGAAQDRAVALFGSRLVALLDLSQAWELGLCDEDQDGGQDPADEDGGSFPVAVVGLRWET